MAEGKWITDLSADTPLLVTGLVATSGVFALWQLWSYALAFLLLGFVLAAAWAAARAARALGGGEKEELWAAGLTAFGFVFYVHATVIALTPDLLSVPLHMGAVAAAAAGSPLLYGRDQDTLLDSNTLERERGLTLDVRVGINTGLVVVGAVGSDLRVEYTAMGDAMVTAEVFLKLIPLLAEKGIHTLGQAREAAHKTYYARLKY